MRSLEINCNATYRVAWIDCLSKEKSLGRSILMLGQHEEHGGLDINVKQRLSVPFATPSSLLNRLTIKAFNTAYWYKSKHNLKQTVSLLPYFYPLDAVGKWNKFYGKRAFAISVCVT